MCVLSENRCYYDPERPDPSEVDEQCLIDTASDDICKTVGKELCEEVLGIQHTPNAWIYENAQYFYRTYL